jgi:hypothetical protein
MGGRNDGKGRRVGVNNESASKDCSFPADDWVRKVQSDLVCFETKHTPSHIRFRLLKAAGA